VAGALRTPAWAHVPDLAALGSRIPILQIALDPVTGFLTRVAVLMATLAVLEQFTLSWTRRRLLAVIVLGIIGFFAGGLPAGSHTASWIAAGLVLAAALIVAYATLLRFDPTIVPVAMGTMTIVSSIGRGIGRAFPGALSGSVVAAVLVAGLGWWWFRALRRARTAIDAGEAHVQV
jgi:hypothetical protein